MTTNRSFVTFLDDLASERPTPGGGGAAAMCGAIGAALVSMVVNSLMGAYGLPRATNEEKAKRAASIQAALKDATLAPLRAVKACFEVIRLSAAAAEKGNLNVASDAGVAVLSANAGLRSAALNVFINAKAIKDRDFAEKQIAEANALLAQAAEMTESVYQIVRTKIGS